MDTNLPKKMPDTPYEIALPCSTEDFGKFIGSLLGKPQTITGAERGAFEVRREDIVNSFHLLNQRVHQQNDAQLIQFTVRLVFDDNSSVLLNSLEDFNSYSEVRPIVVTQAHLSWSFIVKFRDRNHPEKQEIDLSFLTAAPGAIVLGESDNAAFVPIARFVSGGHIAFRIRHTARTWGADIEGLLRGHAKHMVLPQAPAREFVQNHSGKIGVLVALLFFVGTIGACLFTAEHLAAAQLQLISDLVQTPNAIDLKLNKLLNLAAEGFWGKYFFSVLVFVIFSFVSSILIGIWAETSANTRRPSYILLTKKSEQNKTEQDKRYHFRWFSFIGSLVVSVATGIGSNILFSKYWVG